jgi:hypothetical protein
MQSGITVGTLNNLDLELTDSKFPSRDDPISSSFNDDTFQFEEGGVSTSARHKRDRKGSAKTANAGDKKALGIMDSMFEAQQTQIANLKMEVARTSTLLEASREAHAALASNTLKLEDKFTRCSAKIDTRQNIIQENSARDGARFITFTNLLEEVRVFSTSAGKPARDNGNLNSRSSTRLSRQRVCTDITEHCRGSHASSQRCRDARNDGTNARTGKGCCR